MLVPVLVTVKNGFVDQATIAKSGEHLEELFISASMMNGLVPNETDLENGFVSMTIGTDQITISMTWAEASQ